MMLLNIATDEQNNVRIQFVLYGYAKAYVIN